MNPSLRVARPAAAALASLLLVLAFVAGCQRDPASGGQQPPAADSPAATVTALATQLQAGDLAGYARTAVPPALHAELDAAWREDRSRWPLSELPLAGKLPPLLAAFGAEGAEARLQSAFDRQFAGQDKQLDAAAQSLSLWGVEYVNNEGEFSDAERVHYAQVIDALGAWAAAAPLADRARAKASLVRLASAARASGLDEPSDFTALGMAGTLERLQPFVAAAMRTLADYGLDLGASLEGLRVEEVSQEGDRAVVQVSYPLAGHPISTQVVLERIDGRWYPSDSVRNARASLAPAASTEGDDAVPTDVAPADLATPAG